MSKFFSYITTGIQALLFTAPVILLAITCYECAHGWVSYKLSHPTANNAGRLSLCSSKQRRSSPMSLTSTSEIWIRK